MSQWSERILSHFTADLTRLWVACDPDDVLLDEKLLPADIRASIESLCSDWIGTKHDVVHELAELKDSANIEDRIRRIMAWLGEDIVKLQEQVRKLEALASSDERFKLVYLLFGESGGNVLRSFVAAGESADQVLEYR